MFLKKTVYHETIHAIQSNPISFGDKNEFIKSANKKSEIEQKMFYFNRLEKYKELNINERIYFYEQSCDKQLALLIPNIENGYKYNSHFARLLLYLVGRKNIFLELFTQRDDLFLDLQKRKLVGDDFKELLNDQFASTEEIYSIDNYLQFLTKYFYLYEELNTNDYENWLPLILEEEKWKSNQK